MKTRSDFLIRSANVVLQMASALMLNPNGVTAQSPGLAPRLPWVEMILIAYPNGVTARSMRKGNSSEMKPLWGTRTLAFPQGRRGANPGL